MSYNIEINEEQNKKKNPFNIATNLITSETILVTEENTDIKDYMNSHKMFLELEKIGKGEEAENIQFKSEINKEIFNINDVLKDDCYMDTKTEILKTEEVNDVKNLETEGDFSEIEVKYFKLSRR